MYDYITKIASIKNGHFFILFIGYLNGMNCIGSHDGIRCFKRKKEDPDALEYAEIRLREGIERSVKFEHDRLLVREITNREYKLEYEKYRKEIDRLINSYFRVINIME